jgi:PKD repeat protein
VIREPCQAQQAAPRPVARTLARFLALASTLIGAACGNSANPATDAAVAEDGPLSPIDATPLPDRIDPLLWVEFSAIGCAEGGIDGAPCVGAAPLEVTFTAVAPAAIDTYVWTFGDGTVSSEASPTHVFDLPGVYDVSLTVGGPGGTASKEWPGFALVEGAPLGAACGVDAHCEPPLACVCEDGAACAPGLSGGLCSQECNEAVPCPAESACADLDPTGAAAGEEWMQSLCLVACSSTSECRPGFLCRELRASSTDWIQGCFPAGLLADVGGSCIGPDGALDGSLCTSGLCLDEGARGLCAAPCAAETCPSYAACATFNDVAVGALCLARCTADFPCDGDPWLGCVSPGGSSAKGFTVEELPASGGYCAPRSCTTDGDCGPDGICPAGFCESAS